MKKVILVSALCALTASNSFAESNLREARKAGVFFTSAIAGAVLAGPVGMVAAAAGSVWLDDQVEKAAELDETNIELAKARENLDSLNYRLAVAEDSSAQYAQMALDQLQLQMLFKTGDSELTPVGQQRLAHLAEFLGKHSGLNVRLDGFADPRGDADYNLTLSAKRVAAVAEALLLSGVESHRITTYSHGASKSKSREGDYDSYALERVVRIKLSKDNSADDVAQVTLVR